MKKHSISHTVSTLFACTLLALLGLACGQPASDAPAPSTEEPPAAAADGAEAPAGDEVTFEPAYPTDVSTEGLDDDDTAQQQSHSHGSDTHSHDDGEHSHDDGDHSHGEDEHSHGDGDEHAH